MNSCLDRCKCAEAGFHENFIQNWFSMWQTQNINNIIQHGLAVLKFIFQHFFFPREVIAVLCLCRSGSFVCCIVWVPQQGRHTGRLQMTDWCRCHLHQMCLYACVAVQVTQRTKHYIQLNKSESGWKQDTAISTPVVKKKRENNQYKDSWGDILAHENKQRRGREKTFISRIPLLWTNAQNQQQLRNKKQMLMHEYNQIIWHRDTSYNVVWCLCELVENICVHTLVVGQVLVLRKVIGHRVDGGSVMLLLLLLLLLAGAVVVVGRGAVTCGHLQDMMMNINLWTSESNKG